MFDALGSAHDIAGSRRGVGKAGDWYEIIAVNDGSEDDTRKVIEVLKENDHRVRMISYGTNMGKGYAIKRGILESRGKYVIFMDGDGEIGADTLLTYLQSLRDADIIIASKYHSSSVVKVPRARRFLSRCFHLFVTAIIPLRVSDTQVGLKAGRGDAFRKIFQSVLVKRYAFDVEMLAVATLLGLKIVEMPVKIELKTSFKRKEMMRMALDVLGIGYRLRIIKWYQKNLDDDSFYQNMLDSR
jgi:glycosyltransferase involved in cell wall biosynthesis